MNIVTTDIMQRYDALKPKLPEIQTTAEREQKLSKEISTKGTLAEYLVGLEGQELKIQSLISAGKTAEAKDAYDTMVETIDTNRDGITAVASMQGGGTNARTLVALAKHALLSEFNSLDVKTVGGETYKLGQYFSDDTLWKNPGSSFRNRGFSKRVVDGLLNSDDEELRKSLGFFAKDQNYLLNKKAGMDFDSMRIQNNKAADAVVDNWSDIRDTFGDGASRFVQYVHESHTESGAAAPMLKAFLTLAKARAGTTGFSGDSLVSDVMGGYQELLAYCNQGDAVDGKTNARDVTPNKRLMSDAMLLKMATEMEKAGGAGFAGDLHDPNVRQAFRECMSVMADATACATSPDALASDQGINIYKAFADHVTAKATGRASANGFVTNWKRFSDGLDNQITGGRDFARIAYDMTGDAGDYMKLKRAAGGESSCPAADNMKADVVQSLKRTTAKFMVDGSDAATAWAKVSSDPEAARDRMTDLVKSLSRSFSGRGRTAAAIRLASEVVSAVENGGRLNIETRIRDLVSDQNFAKANPLAHESLANWFYGQTEAAYRYADKLAQLDQHWRSVNGGSLNDRTAAAAMSRLQSRVAELTRLAEGPNKGVYPSSIIDAELNRGYVYGTSADGTVVRVPTDDLRSHLKGLGPNGTPAEQERLASAYISPEHRALLKAQAEARRRPTKADSDTVEE